MYSLNNYIKTYKTNEFYKKWYTQKQSLGIRLLGIGRKQKRKKGMVAQKLLSHLLL